MIELRVVPRGEEVKDAVFTLDEVDLDDIFSCFEKWRNIIPGYDLVDAIKDTAFDKLVYYFVIQDMDDETIVKYVNLAVELFPYSEQILAVVKKE